MSDTDLVGFSAPTTVAATVAIVRLKIRRSFQQSMSLCRARESNVPLYVAGRRVKVVFPCRP